MLRPGLSCFVCSTRTGYANRPNTGNDGTGLSPCQTLSLVGAAHFLPRSYPASSVLGEPLASPGRPACASRAPVASYLPTSWGLPCLRTLSLLYMLSRLPGAGGWAYCFAQFRQPYQPSPKGCRVRPGASVLFELARVYSRCGLHT